MHDVKISISELKNVKGVGDKTLTRIKEHLSYINKSKEMEEDIAAIEPPNELVFELDSIYCGDSVELMRRNIPDNTINLTVTSPPYDALRDYEGYSFNYKTMLRELYRVTVSGGVVVWVVGDSSVAGSETGMSFQQAMYAKSLGFNLHDTMIYEKNTSSFPASRKDNRYTQIFEYMFVLSKGSPSKHNLICDKPNRWAGHTNWGKNTARGRDGLLVDVGSIKKVPDFSPRNNIWKYVVGGGYASEDDIAHEHPAIFPEKLAEDHILSWSNEGDIIFDPMCGSGTTCKMAKLNDRKFIGIDISEEYCSIARDRISVY